jgi:hypothetical protein
LEEDHFFPMVVVGVTWEESATTVCYDIIFEIVTIFSDPSADGLFSRKIKMVFLASP